MMQNVLQAGNNVQLESPHILIETSAYEHCALIVQGQPNPIEQSYSLTANRDDYALVVNLETQREPFACHFQCGTLRAVIQVNPSDYKEKALILANIYRKNGALRLKAMLQGFNNGERGVQEHYGLSVPVFVSMPAIRVQHHAIRQSNSSIIDVNPDFASKSQALAEQAKKTIVNVLGSSQEVAMAQYRNERALFPTHNLQKMETVIVHNSLRSIHIGLGWQSKVGATGVLKNLGSNKAINADLDLEIALYDRFAKFVDGVDIHKLRTDTLAVVHYGDASKGGNGIQDDEMAAIQLDMLPANVDYVVVRVIGKCKLSAKH